MTGTGFATGHVPRLTLDLPGSCRRAPCPARGPLALLVSVEILAPARDQKLPVPDWAAALRLPTLVRTADLPPSERGSDPAAPLRQGKGQTTQTPSTPGTDCSRKRGRSSQQDVGGVAQPAFFHARLRGRFRGFPERLRVTCGPRDRPRSTPFGTALSPPFRSPDLSAVERSPLSIWRCENDIEVLVQGNATKVCGTWIPQVAGRLWVVPRPADRRCRSASPGRGRERPGPLGCLVRHRGGSACAGPCRPPRRVAPVPTIPPGRELRAPRRGGGAPVRRPAGRRGCPASPTKTGTRLRTPIMRVLRSASGFRGRTMSGGLVGACGMSLRGSGGAPPARGFRET